MEDISLWHLTKRKLDKSLSLGVGTRRPIDLDEASFAVVDAHAINTPTSKCLSVSALALHLTSPFVEDVLKLRAVFCWVATHIAYDYKGYLSGVRGPQTAEGILKSRVSVCEGYANLFLALCEQANAGLKCFKITGAAMGVGLEAGDPAVNLDAHA
ncbi:UNVERIFIED_CONTAM: hypothetical protein HDU68_007610 [Siphonaria sp. JEL0065]|nr:hypothetical protein HDU68_007610 [Siphonaria sp. JEL0065]